MRVFSTLLTSFVIYYLHMKGSLNIFYIFDNDGRNLCAGLFWDSFHRPVCLVFENKGRLLHNQLGVSV